MISFYAELLDYKLILEVSGLSFHFKDEKVDYVVEDGKVIDLDDEVLIFVEEKSFTLSQIVVEAEKQYQELYDELIQERSDDEETERYNARQSQFL